MFNEIEENRPRDMIGKLGSFGRADRVSLLAEVKTWAWWARLCCVHYVNMLQKKIDTVIPLAVLLM